MTVFDADTPDALARELANVRAQLAAQTARADAAQAAQAAMADILQLIGTTGVDTGPVLDRIVEACERLFPSLVVSVFLVDASGRIDLRCMHFTAAGRAVHDEAQRAQILGTMRAIYPMPLTGTVAEMAFARGSVVDFGDVTQDPDVPASVRTGAQRLGMRYAVLTAPLLWQGQGVGTIGMTRSLEHAYSATQGFSPQEHALVMGFASQAVIAIRNARLIQETQDALHTVQERTAALDESLAYQTAISNVLRVISESPADVTPVFQTILQTADRLFGTVIGAVFRYDGQQVHLMATEGWPAAALENARRLYPGPPDPTQMSGRVMLRARCRPSPTPLPTVATTRRPAAPASGGACSARPCCATGADRRTGDCLGRAGSCRPAPGGTAADLCRTGGDRGRERAADQRNPRGAGTAESQRRHPARDQPFADRGAAGVRRDCQHGGVRCWLVTGPS